MTNQARPTAGRPKVPPADMDQVRRFFGLICDPAIACMEVRVLDANLDRGRLTRHPNWSSTFSGWFDDPGRLVAELDRLSGVSAYATVNPVKRDLLALADNELVKAKTNTKDEDVAAILHWFIDIDPRRKSGISSTDAELAAAVSRRDLILADHPELRAASFWGRSGNGAFIVARLLGYANDPAGRDMIAGATDLIAARYSDDLVEIDPATKNPSRIMAIPGTVKCKGSNRPERPWRLACFDSPEDELHPFDIRAWLARQPKPEPAAGLDEPKAKAEGRKARPMAEGPAAAYAAEALAREVDTLLATGEGGRNAQLNKSAFNMGQLIGAGAIERAEVERQLGDAAARIKLNPREIPKSIKSGIEAGIKDPRDLSSVGTKSRVNGRAHAPGTNRHAKAGDTAEGPPPGRDGEPGPERDPILPNESANDPYRLARLYRDQRCQHPDGLTLRYWRGEFHRWDRSYRPVTDKELRAELGAVVKAEFDRINVAAIRRWERMGGDASGEPIPTAMKVTEGLKTNALGNLATQTLLKTAGPDSVPAQPAWLDADPPWPPEEILAARDALVHLPSLAAGLPAIIPPTPRFFSEFALDYDFQDEAPPPRNWLTFLGSRPVEPGGRVKFQIWPNAPRDVETLQEFMGLLLLPDTSHQKILALIGPKRSGKGTIARIIRALVGPDNCAGPTLSGLATNFGLAPMLGKHVAIIDDARLSGRTDQAVITERLLTISGEGAITVDRKHAEAMTVKLPTRFVLISNELPRLADSSGALAGRMILLRFVESFYGREDRNLTDLLMGELPGILLWAIEGWRRLRERGHFIQPESGRELIEEMEDLASPIGAFLKERCEVRPGLEIMAAELFGAWKTWCEDKGREHVGDEQLFGRNLRTALPYLKTTSKRLKEGERLKDGERKRFYEGLDLKTPEF